MKRLDDGKEWSFYLINNGNAPVDSAVMNGVSYEWGDLRSGEAADVRVTALAPGAYALIWRGDSSGAELRMDLSLLVRIGDREVRLLFEFPKLYRKTNLPLVACLGKPDWQEAAEG